MTATGRQRAPTCLALLASLRLKLPRWAKFCTNARVTECARAAHRGMHALNVLTRVLSRTQHYTAATLTTAMASNAAANKTPVPAAGEMGTGGVKTIQCFCGECSVTATGAPVGGDNACLRA